MQNQVHLVRSSILAKVGTMIVPRIYCLILLFAAGCFAFCARGATLNFGNALPLVPPIKLDSSMQSGTAPLSPPQTLDVFNSATIRQPFISDQKITATLPTSRINPLVTDKTVTAAAMPLRGDVNQIIAVDHVSDVNSIKGFNALNNSDPSTPLRDQLSRHIYNVGSMYRDEAQNAVPVQPRFAKYLDGRISSAPAPPGGPAKPSSATSPQSYTVSVTSNANPSILGNPLSLSASVNTPSGAAQSGSVTFTDNGVVVGIADVVAGTAVLPISSSTNEEASLCTGIGCLGPGTVVKYISGLGCAYQDTDLMLGGGHDDTDCINAALASATAANPILLRQDGKSLISGNGIQGPAGGNWGIAGSGASITVETITNCSISGGVATLTTTANTFAVGQWVDLNNFTTCPLNWSLTQVLPTGLSATQFQVMASGSVPSTSENANASAVSGTGFFSSNGTADLISNGIPPAPWGCAMPAGPTPTRGSNILLQNFALNARGYNNGLYCFNIHLRNINNIRIEHIVSYESPRFETLLDNVGNVVIEGSIFFKSRRDNGDSSDGIHVDGPANDLVFTNDHFRTGDDSVALNATEGYCGPISRVKWTNSTLDDSWDAIRIYNGDLDVCSNGLVPLVDTVGLDNVSGSVYSGILANFGNSIVGLGNLNPAITNFQWNNSTVTDLHLSPMDSVFWLTDNVGKMSFTNFTYVNPNTSGFFGENVGDTTQVGLLSLNHFSLARTTTGNRLSQLFNGKSIGSLKLKTINVDGFSIIDSGGPYPPIYCLICSDAPGHVTAAQTYTNNIDNNVLISVLPPDFTQATAASFPPNQPFNQLPIGQHTIIASYSDDQNNPAVSSLPFIQTVQAAVTGVTITSSENPAASNSSLTLSCQVFTTSPVGGTVTFQDGAHAIGTVNLDANLASIVVRNLSPGVHSIIAVYSGDGIHPQSVSPTLLQTVLQNTSVTLIPKNNPSFSLDPVIFTVKVANGTNLPPTGSVVLAEGAVRLGDLVLDQTGTATIAVGSLGVGAHSIVASYLGDSLNLQSASLPQIQSIQLRPTTVSLSSSTKGTQVVLTASIQYTGAVMPIGIITFVSNGIPIGVATLDKSGVASSIINSQTSSSKVTATYSGDGIYAGSVSAETAIVGTPDFTIQINPSALSLNFQQQGAVTVSLASLNGLTDTISLSCIGLSNSMGCDFGANNLILIPSQPQTVHVLIDSISVSRAGLTVQRNTMGYGKWSSMCFLPGGLIFAVYVIVRRRFALSNRVLQPSMWLLLIASTVGLGGCGSLRVRGTPPGTYTIGVSATSAVGHVTHTAQVVIDIRP